MLIPCATFSLFSSLLRPPPGSARPHTYLHIMRTMRHAVQQIRMDYLPAFFAVCHAVDNLHILAVHARLDCRPSLRHLERCHVLALLFIHSPILLLFHLSICAYRPLMQTHLGFCLQSASALLCTVCASDALSRPRPHPVFAKRFHRLEYGLIIYPPRKIALFPRYRAPHQFLIKF